LTETQQSGIQELVAQVRERLAEQFRVHDEHLDRIEKDVQDLRHRHARLRAGVEEQLATLASYQPPVPATKILASVQNLMIARLPEEVLTVLAGEAERLGVRAAVFDVRGKAAWGACARGFGAQFSDKAFQSVIVSLSPESPFRQVYESGGAVDVTFEQLRKNRNVLERLKPAIDSSILLLPVRSAGSVSSIVYVDAGESGRPLPVDELKIFTEFAGAQLDRLMALSGGFSGVEEGGASESASEAAPQEERVKPAAEAVPEAETPPETTPVQTQESQPYIPEPAVQAFVPSDTLPASVPAGLRQGGSTPFSPSVLVADAPVPGMPAPKPDAASFDLSSLPEEEQKIHRDAKRFAKLLVSEIELYNKAKVADGRQNKDLYIRLKPDIDRSRQTYDKRFGKTVAAQFDYFHEEMVRTLACQDASLLGADYPGPAS
jgi:hypothetical protein